MIINVTDSDSYAVHASPAARSAPVFGVTSTGDYCRPDDVVAAPNQQKSFTPPGFEIRYGVGATPVGLALVASTDRGVCALYLSDPGDQPQALDRLHCDFPGVVRSHDPGSAVPVLARVVAHLVEGRPWDDIPLDLRGSPFQLRVWDALRAIPRGATVTYGEVARRLGLPAGASRAVGTACGANPVSLLVPCHRVVRSDGGLGGYYWGLDRKQAILDLERIVVG